MSEANTRYVMGVDPGTTTGLAIVAFERQIPRLPWATERPWEEAAKTIWARVRELAARDLVVVCEAYWITARTAQRGQKGAEDAMEMNGVARFACQIYGVSFAPRQKSSDKDSVKDASLKAAGLWTPGRRHANDAVRHCVLYAQRHEMIDNRVLLP